jgi:hypothetical protein
MPSGAQELLGCKECHMVFGAVQELKLGLNGAQPVISLKRFSCFSEGWWTGCQKVGIGSGSGSMGVSRPHCHHELSSP